MPMALLLHSRNFVLLFIIILSLKVKIIQGRNQINQLYREQYETYETLQGRKHPLLQRRQQNVGLRIRYVEFAETEFSRSSFYFPVPFLSPVNNRFQVIPARTLTQLIRQHIAHNRMKQLSLQNIANNSILQGVRQLTELRQTPFRRWSDNNTILSYEEKRRHWKAELKRRLQGHKVPTRIIPPLLISGGGQSSVQTDREPDDRYFVTYSPQTRIYQVSRKPPPFLYTTNRDSLPEQLDGDEELHVTAEPTKEKSTEIYNRKEIIYPATETVTTTTSSLSSLPEPTNTIPISTSTNIPQLVFLQKAQLIYEKGKEHKEQVSALKKSEKTNTIGKQILFLDDYEQIQGDGDDEGKEHDEGEIEAPATTITTTLAPTVPASRPTNTRIKELEEARQNLRQQLFQEEQDDIFADEEDDSDEDLFFFKPDVGQQGRENEPFQILVHHQDRGKIQ